MITEKRNGEIDLIEVFLKIYIFFKKNFWFLLITILIGAGLGYSTKFLANEHYKSSMLIESYTIPDEIIIEYIEGFQNIISDKNYEFLSSQIDIDIDNLKGIKEIKVEKLYDEKNNKDLEYIRVSVIANTHQIFETLSAGLLKYLGKKDYITSEVDIFIKQNKILIEKIDEEIKQLEKLQEMNINQTPAKGDVNIYNEQKSFQSELIGLLTKKLELEKELKFALPFRIIEDFGAYKQPIRTGVTYTVSGGLALLFFTLLYLIFRDINKKLKEKM